MTFKTLSALLESRPQIQEAPEQEGSSLIGPKQHSVLTRAELIRFGSKMDQAASKLEEIRSIFKHVPGASGPAHKLGHIGEKGGFDMSHFTGVNELLDKLEEAIEEMHMSWGIQVQSETGALDDEPSELADEEDHDDLPSNIDKPEPK